ncbi:ArsR/SmtB family transcription factor [Rothia halotolerans]|uniref:ArsR/SmtB family transcription factor n=1 Tax=Rothia halotolerans TaxID=405770 RepID=UPI00101E0DCC|nr:metalloregulator ArsR/SmtB family transcription factor [Rothia halotolerans]
MTAAVPAPETETCAPVATCSIAPEDATTSATALKALADPLRLRILSAVASDPRGECCVCDLAELAEVTQPTVSHHLRILKETGWLVSDRRGTWVHYRIALSRRDAVDTLFGSVLDSLTRH